MPNIKFSYRYRDASNYKAHSFIIFHNPSNIDLTLVESIIRSKLIEGTWFYANQWGLPNLYLHTFDFELDPTWHEFESVEYTSESPTLNYLLEDFIQRLSVINP